MPPVNDDFASATVLTGDSGHVTFSNVGATTEAGEPANAEGHSVWFKWTTALDGDAYVRTGLTPLPDWDSYIAVHTGTSLADLVEITSRDDNDLQAGHVDPFGTSKASWTATAGTTYWIQVTAYDDVSGPVERSDLRLDWSVTAPPPDPPGPFGVNPLEQVVGRTVVLNGTNMDLVTTVLFGTAPAVFVINSPTLITATVPPNANGTTITISNAGGSHVHAFQALFPGRWIQPPDQVYEYQIGARQYDTPLVDDSRTSLDGSRRGPLQSFGQGSTPDPTGQVLESPSTGAGATVGFRTFSASYAVGHMDYVPIEFDASAYMALVGIDLAHIITSDTPDVRRDFMPVVRPSTADVLAAEAATYEFDLPNPDGTGDGGRYVDHGFDFRFRTDQASGYWVDDINHKSESDFTDTLYTAHTQYRRLPTTAYSGDGWDALFQLDPADTWPADAGDVIVSHQTVPSTTGQLTDSDNGGYGNWQAFIDLVDPVDFTPGYYDDSLHLDVADLDDGHSFAALFTFDRFTADADMFAPPYLNTGSIADSSMSLGPTAPLTGGLDVWSPYSNGVIWKELDVNGNAWVSYTYRPPRYRFLYTVPQAVTQPPLRQFPRDDTLGGAPRPSRQSQSVQASARQGWTGTYR